MSERMKPSNAAKAVFMILFPHLDWYACLANRSCPFSYVESERWWEGNRPLGAIPYEFDNVGECIDFAEEVTRGAVSPCPEVDQLLADMRSQVKWSHVAEMPIPLYERMKAAIQAMRPAESTPACECDEISDGEDCKTCGPSLEIFCSEIPVVGERKLESIALGIISIVANSGNAPARYAVMDAIRPYLRTTEPSPSENSARPAVNGNKRRYLQRLLNQIIEHDDIVEPDTALPRVKAAALQDALEANYVRSPEPVSSEVDIVAGAKAIFRRKKLGAWKALSEGVQGEIRGDAQSCAEAWGLKWK